MLRALVGDISRLTRLAGASSESQLGLDLAREVVSLRIGDPPTRRHLHDWTLAGSSRATDPALRELDDTITDLKGLKIIPPYSLTTDTRRAIQHAIDTAAARMADRIDQAEKGGV